MNTGTMAAREADKLVGLDSDPTKLIEIVAIGKELLMTRGALVTFSIANDVAKHFDAALSAEQRRRPAAAQPSDLSDRRHGGILDELGSTCCSSTWRSMPRWRDSAGSIDEA